MNAVRTYLAANPAKARAILAVLVGVLILLLLTSCATAPAPVKVQIKEVPVETIVPIPADLTRPIAAPARPANRCKDDQGRATLCNRDLAGWVIDYAGALDKANARLREILGLQPKAAP